MGRWLAPNRMVEVETVPQHQTKALATPPVTPIGA